MSKNPLTIEAFAEWAEKQPADKTYEYIDSTRCACFQYSAAIGMDTSQAIPAWRQDLYDGSAFWHRVDDAAAETPYTFGALAARLRALSA